MIPNLSAIQIHRAIMHQIVAKTNNTEHATVIEEDHLFRLTTQVKETIKNRLADAAGKQSKAFELDIENSEPGSFFYEVEIMKEMNASQFIQASKRIANLLAEAQTRNNIQGSYLIVLDCTNRTTNHGLYIVIKAELHQALKYQPGDRSSTSNIELLENVFLSPTQKLFKIGIILERSRRDTSAVAPNDRYIGYLFDDQFRTGTKPAEYFYKDFLGFSIAKNAKIQTKRYFEKTENFIKHEVEDFETKSDLLNALKLQFRLNNNTTITPRDFAQDNLPENLQDLYIRMVANDLPSTFTKDPILISQALQKKKISFPHQVTLSGPSEQFDNYVEIINSQNAISNLELDSESTIIRIKGRPYSNE